MADFFERGDRDETRDWRKFAIPALGSLILVLVGVVVSLVTLDRGGIKSEICDLRSEMRERASDNKKLITAMIEKDRVDSERLRDLELLIHLSFPERERLFRGDAGGKSQFNDHLKNRLKAPGGP